MKIANLILFVALAVCGFFVFRYLLTAQPLRFGANETPETQSVAVVLYGYLITLAGVILGSAYRELQVRKERGESQIASVPLFAKSVFLSLDFWMSLCGSPLVYALLWKSLDGGNIAGLSVIALQNGFCCTMVVGNFMKRGPEQKPTPKTT